VYGFGEEKTSHPFLAACDKFIYMGLLCQDAVVAVPKEPNTDPAAPTDVSKPAAAESPKRPKTPVEFIARILDDIDDEDEDDWVQRRLRHEHHQTEAGV
jgi:hypothetical protein